MKACERWLKSFYKKHRGSAHYNPDFRAGWKAALKRVLEECHSYQSQDVIDWILKELREK